MGGRGTGKTTLLYFLKSVLDARSMDDMYSNRLLRSNLGSGTITVEFETEDDRAFNLTKTIDDMPQPYLLPSLDFVSFQQLAPYIECDFYEAGRIEEIGRSSKDRLELIDKKIKSDIGIYFSEVREVQMDLDSNAQEIKSFNKRLALFDGTLEQYELVKIEFENYKNIKPTGINEEENKSFEAADQNEKVRRQESRFFNKAIDILKMLQGVIYEADLDLTEYYLSEVIDPHDFQNVEIMNEGEQLIINTVDTTRAKLKEIGTFISAKQKSLDEIFTFLLNTHDIQQAEFVKLKQKFEQNREYINNYNALSKRVSERETLLKDREELIKRRNRLKEHRLIMVNKLNKLKQLIFRRRLEVVKQLNLTFNGEVVITLTHAGIKDDFQDKLRSGLKGSGLQYNVLIPRIVECFSTVEFAQIIHKEDAETLRVIAGIDVYRATALIEALRETDAIYEIESLYCNDLPEFKLKIAADSHNLEDNYRKTDELSMGQRCTTVLPIIFAVSTNPLIIDQPEDNLDNRYITQSICNPS